ncbi:unnamed protein product [Nezara viridula]|uniref:Uncharacterized protein n=1 Tax=Nezara viridula TaxID=85310 RepID=A0A9P0HLU4_NEZVI|nr:unnamed protein product [Nezara viridula]
MPKNKTRIANQISLTRSQIRQIFTPYIDDSSELLDSSAELSKEDSSRHVQSEVVFRGRIDHLLTFGPVSAGAIGDRCKSAIAEEEAIKMDPEVAKCFSDIKQALAGSIAEMEKVRHCNRCKKVRLNYLREDTVENVIEA